MKKIVLTLIFASIWGVFPLSTFAAGFTGVSENWAGYVATGGTYTSISGSWVVPSIEPSNDDRISSEWIGIGGINSSDLLQSGIEQISRGNTIEYIAWYEALPDKPTTIPLRIFAGDTVSVNLNYTGSNTWHLSFINTTSKQSFSKDIIYKSSFSSADWIEERPQVGSRFLPNADFGTVTFMNSSTVHNGVTQTLSDANARPLIMAENGTVLAEPSSIGSNKSTFSVSISQSAKIVREPVLNSDSNRIVFTTPEPAAVISAFPSSEAVKIKILQNSISARKERIRIISKERKR